MFKRISQNELKWISDDYILLLTNIVITKSYQSPRKELKYLITFEWFLNTFTIDFAFASPFIRHYSAILSETWFRWRQKPNFQGVGKNHRRGIKEFFLF